jgi:hypothetical protein
LDLAAAGARHVRYQPVKDLAALFIEVETLVDKLTQEATALRSTVAVGEIEATRGRVVIGGGVVEPCGAVADGEDAGADDGADACGVDDLVPQAFFEFAFEPDVRIIRFWLAIVVDGEAPARAWNDGGLSVLGFPDGQLRGGLVNVGGRVGFVPQGLPPWRGMQRPMRKPTVRMVLVGLESNRHLALDGFAVWSERLWCAQAGEPGHALNVPLPAAECDGPAAVHQKAIAGFDLVSRGQGCSARRKAVERHADALTAVDHV